MKNLFRIILFFAAISSTFSQNYWIQVADFNSSPACYSFDSTGNIYLGTLDHGVYFSSDNGISWTGKSNGLVDLNIYSLALHQNGTLYAGTFNHGLFFSSDNGNLWNQSGLLVQTKIRAIIITYFGTLIAGTDGNGIYRSTNSGTNWQKINSPQNIYSLCVSAGNIVAGSRNPDCIFLSLDDGLIWNQAFSSTSTFNSIIATSEGRVYSVTGDFTSDMPLGYILARSDNYGLQWFISSNFPSSSYGIAVNTKGDLFVGRYESVWKSTNYGINWETLSSGIDSSNNVLISLACSPSGYLFAGRQGGQLFRSSQKTIAVKKISSQIPLSFKLFQNYPNPFNPSTKINFELPSTENSAGGFVIIKIFDILGHEITTLLNRKLSSGKYELEWNAINFPGGVYFYRISYFTSTKTLPMILLK